MTISSTQTNPRRFSAVLPLLLLVSGMAGCSPSRDRAVTSDSDTAAADANVNAPLDGSPPVGDDANVAAVDALTEASPAYEAGPSVVAAGTVDGAALRKRIGRRLRTDRSPVTLLEGKSALELGMAICRAAVPEVPASLPVLLKPNIGGFAGLKNPKRHSGDDGVKGRTTDPEFVRGVIRCLRARGHKQITIADSKSEDASFWPRLIKASGYEQMAAEEGADLVALNDDGVFNVGGSKPGKPLTVSGMEKTSVPTLLMPKIVADHLDHGLFISLPKVKTHRFSVVSLGIKNLQGTVMYSDRAPAYRQKWRSHRELANYIANRKKPERPEDRAAYIRALEVFAERMVDILEVEAPHVILAEGAPAMSGDGFHRLTPSAELVAIGGTNPILVDAVGARFLGLFDNEELAAELGGHRTSPLIEVAAARFNVDLSKVKIVGNGAPLLEKPRPVHLIGFAPFVLRSGQATRPEVRAKHSNTPAIELDGVADEPAWATAETISWDTNYAGKATGIATHARFLWNRAALYVHFELEGAGLFADPTRPTDVEHAELYKEDCVELFLAPDPQRPRRYFEIEVGPYGHWLDIAVDLERKKKRFDSSWESRLRVATKRDQTARRVSIEVALPADALSGALAAGRRLPIGLFRLEGRTPNRNYLAWSPARTPKPKFHVPEAFGTLVLEP